MESVRLLVDVYWKQKGHIAEYVNQLLPKEMFHSKRGTHSHYEMGSVVVRTLNTANPYKFYIPSFYHGDRGVETFHDIPVKDTKMNDLLMSLWTCETSVPLRSKNKFISWGEYFEKK